MVERLIDRHRATVSNPPCAVFRPISLVRTSGELLGIEAANDDTAETDTSDDAAAADLPSCPCSGAYKVKRGARTPRTSRRARQINPKRVAPRVNINGPSRGWPDRARLRSSRVSLAVMHDPG